MLSALAARVGRRVRWYCTPVARRMGEAVLDQHRERIAALATRDERRAAEIMRAHTGHTRRTYHGREKG